MSKELLPPAPQDVLENTYNMLIPLWMQNYAENFTAVHNGLDAEALPHRKEPCICIGGGPSLDKYKHIRQIRKTGWKHAILTCDKSLNRCLCNHLRPDVVASVDGSPVIESFYQHPAIKVHAKTTAAAFNITIHPKVRERWESYGGKIYWFVALLDNPKTPEKKMDQHSITFILHLLSNGKGIISAIGNVGSFIWNLAYSMECDPIILVGYDFSEQVAYKSQAIYFNGMTRMFMQQYTDLKKAKEAAAALHQVETNPDFKTKYLVNPIWKRYRESLAAHIITSGKHTINCTGNGALHTEAIKAPNFEAMNLTDALRKYE
jgi:hypothetical protein